MEDQREPNMPDGYEPKQVEEIDSSRVNHATKDYQCALCEEVIKKGQPHRRIVYKIDHKLKNFRFHLVCYHAR
jgi:hypothetical protein